MRWFYFFPKFNNLEYYLYFESCIIQVHSPVSERMTLYVQTIYGKEAYTDEPVDYIQRTVNRIQIGPF